MPVSKRMVIEDKEGNKLYPHTFAEVVTMNNGENLETKITNMQTSIDNSASDWGSVTGKPETFPPSTHTHDDRYYTETETNNLLNGKAPTTHTHTTSQITNLAYPVTSVAGKTGAVTLTSADVGLGNVPNYGASNSVTSASNTTLATSGAVKTAYDRAEQAFQSASSGKIAIANAITGKGVSASGSDTHQVLANKIGQILQAKKINPVIDGLAVSNALYRPARYTVTLGDFVDVASSIVAYLPNKYVMNGTPNGDGTYDYIINYNFIPGIPEQGVSYSHYMCGFMCENQTDKVWVKTQLQYKAVWSRGGALGNVESVGRAFGTFSQYPGHSVQDFVLCSRIPTLTFYYGNSRQI